jgi:hypothetical protein
MSDKKTKSFLSDEKKGQSSSEDIKATKTISPPSASHPEVIGN